MKEKSWVGILFSYTKGSKIKLSLSILLAIISVFGGLLPYLGVYHIIIMFFAGTQTGSKILYWAGICLGGYLIKILFYGFSTVLSHRSAYKILENIRLAIADKLMKVPLGTVLNESIGKMKNVIVDRVETIELPLAHLIPEGLSSLLLAVSVLVYLIVVDWRMAIAGIISIPLAAIPYGIVMRTYNKKYDDYMKASNYVNGVIVEYIEGIEVIKAFNHAAISYEKFQKAINDFKDYTLDWFQSTWKLMNLGSAILPSTLLGTLPLGMYLYITESLTPADLTISIILSLGIVETLTKFTVFVNDLKSIEYALRDADQFLNLKELPSVRQQVKLKNYNIKLENVSFSYLQDENNKENVLTNIDLEIPEGSFTALVGPSGGGKSTIARLMARFWDVGKGAIKIGDTDLRDIPLTQLTDTVSFVTQDNFLFNSSLLENIRLGNSKASDEEVKEAAKAACCHEFIEELDGGYNTLAGEAGNKLSGGEKQRIAIARAILKNAPIVMLDEATAFADPENEDKIQKSIAALTKGKTLLVIAHRLSTIRNADNIVVLNNGRIEDTGSHEKLLKDCKLYRDMWQAHIGSKAWPANSDQNIEGEVVSNV